jgi:hypothetical protein
MNESAAVVKLRTEPGRYAYVPRFQPLGIAKKHQKRRRDEQRGLGCGSLVDTRMQYN